MREKYSTYGVEYWISAFLFYFSNYRTRNSLQYHLSTAHRDRVHTAPRGRPRIQRPTSPSITESDLPREADGLSQNLDNEPNLNTNSSLHLQFP